MAKILFKYGTRAKYDALAVKDPSALYFLTDTGEIYRGAVNLARGNHYEGIRQTNETDLDVITRVLGVTPPLKDDIFVVKTIIANDKLSYASYIYDGVAWSAMDGNYDAKTVYFNKDLVFTHEVGYVKPGENGSIVIPTKGKNVNELLEYLFVKELNPTIVNPNTTINLVNAGEYEVGTNVQSNYSSNFFQGKYEFEPSTEITGTYKIEDSQKRVLSTDTGTFGEVIADEVPYFLTETVSYSKGKSPMTNMGNYRPELAIAAGTTSDVSESIVGYRNIFYGALDTNQTLDSQNCRSGYSAKAIACSIECAAKDKLNANRIFVAIPKNSGLNLTKVSLTSTMNVDITQEFKKLISSVNISGVNNYPAAEYNVWIYQPAHLDVSETYLVNIS